MSTADNGYQLRFDSVVVGLSTIVGVTPIAGQQSVKFYPASLTGISLLCGGASLTWGSGYPVLGEQIMNDFRGKFYLCAAGATCTVNVLRFLTTGES